MDAQFFVCLQQLPEPDRSRLSERFKSNDPDILNLTADLSEASVQIVVDCLKSSADRHWGIDAKQSVELAKLIHTIGVQRSNESFQALGLMARGDASKLFGESVLAWTLLGEAGDIYARIGDPVGWARTRIGRLFLSVDLNLEEEALADAEKARQIFHDHDQPLRLLRLTLSLAQFYGRREDSDREIALYHDALQIALDLGETAADELCMIYNNWGIAARGLGDFAAALEKFEQAYQWLQRHERTSGAALARLNVASVYLKQGLYRSALRILHETLPVLDETRPLDAAYNRRCMVECLLALNRSEEAYEIGERVVEDFLAMGSEFEAARMMLDVSFTTSKMRYHRAWDSLNQAEGIFKAHAAGQLLDSVYLRRGQLALANGEIAAALDNVSRARESHTISLNRFKYAQTILLEGQIYLSQRQWELALRAAEEAITLAHECNAMTLEYSAFLLRGKVSQANGNPEDAVEHYRRALSIVQAMQRDLSLTLRSNFLEDKNEAFHNLMRLYLQQGRHAEAFMTLEESKAQVLLDHVFDPDRVRWPQTAETRPLLENLAELRGKHQWLSKSLFDADAASETPFEPDEARRRLLGIEKQIRATIEKLYLTTSFGKFAAIPSLEQIRSAVDQDTCLISFYTDGAERWAFALDRNGIAAHKLDIQSSELESLLQRLDTNIARALSMPAHHWALKPLTARAQEIAQALYEAFLCPLAHHLEDAKRLIVVPYGDLHYVPLNVLYANGQYLIETHELVVLPSASLLTLTPPRRSGGVVAIAHNQAHDLEYAAAEASTVYDLFGGSLYTEDMATRSALPSLPVRILHVAAHGDFRLDQPDLSSIQLADGDLLVDDLFQCDMSYELVTLSACETGRGHVAPGDELIGLGRGFLYNGTGALVASLWRINDEITVAWMELFYRALHEKQSKAWALREAQCALLRSWPELHPAFWGAFQLIGNPSPLSFDET